MGGAVAHPGRKAPIHAIDPGGRCSATGTLLVALAVSGAPLQPGAAQQTSILPLAIHPGTCFTLQDTPTHALDGIGKPTGTGVRALPGYSETVVPASLGQLQAAGSSIVLTRSGKLTGILACGEINNVFAADGTIAVGLREQSGSMYAGVALLVPNGTYTTVRVYAAGGLSGGLPTEALDPELRAVDAVVSVSVDDSTITADQVLFEVGQRVEFSVTNNGAEPHEVMLEDVNADEVPLIDNGVQTETEDLDVGGTGSFAMTFTKPGSYQLADHIGDNTIVLTVTVQ